MAGGAAAGGIYGYCTYESAIAGQCGCDIQQQALSMSQWEYAGANALAGGIIAGTAVATGAALAAAPPLALIVVGGVGAVVSLVDFGNTVNIIRNEAGPTWCTVTRLMLDIAGIVLGTVGIAQGVRAWRASGSILTWESGPGTGVPGKATRPGYAGEPDGFYNHIPGDLEHGYNGMLIQDAIAAQDYLPSQQFLFGGPEIANTTKYLYVIDESGNIWVTRNSGTLHHPDLVDGQNVYGAGEMYINNTGKITRIDDQSGHYLPQGYKFFPYLSYLLDQLGLNVTNDVFH